MLDRFFRQFSGPSGLLGHVAGWLMARKNRLLNAWAVDLLEVDAAARVLEIGYGPGLAAATCAVRTSHGVVAGIDRSEVMQGQARRRVRRAAPNARVDLRLGSAEKLPFPDAGFTRALTVNSLPFWPEPEAALAELHRVLAPAGRLVVVLRMRREGAGRLDRSRFGMTEERLAQVRAMLGAAGFRGVEMTRRELAGEDLTALIALR